MKAVIGVDFGTLSARALVVDARDGSELGTAVSEYRHGVMDRVLAATGEPLPPQWALQDPADYVEALRTAVPAAVRAAGLGAEQVVGIATAFTASTPLPVLADGTPLCEAFPDRPHAYVKLWKHHAAQRHADRINAVAEERGEPWLARYGGRISSEWAVRQGAAGARRGPRALRAHGPLDRGRGLDRLAAVRARDAQRLHGRLQGHPPGRGLSRPRTTCASSTSASATSWPPSSRTRSRRSARAPAG